MLSQDQVVGVLCFAWMVVSGFGSCAGIAVGKGLNIDVTILCCD